MSALALPGELTQAQASACLRGLATGVNSTTALVVVVDASGLFRFDSAALAVLLELRRQSLAIGKRFAVQGLPARLRNLAMLYGIADLVPAA